MSEGEENNVVMGKVFPNKTLYQRKEESIFDCIKVP